MNYGSTALLPTGTNVNPSHPRSAEYFDEGQTAYILKDGNKIRCATSFGGRLQGWGVGTTHEVHHDQAGHRLGYFTVIGIVEFATELLLDGETVDRKIPHWVFK